MEKASDIPWNFYKSIKSGNTGIIRSIRFSNDGIYCMTGHNDKSIRLWNPVKGLLMKTYMGHGQEVLDITSSSDNSKLASGSRDQVVLVWDVVSGNVIRRFREHNGAVNCVSFNPDEGSLVVSGSNDSKCFIWDTKARGSKPIQSLEESRDSILSIYLSDHEIITSSVDFNLRVYDIRMGKLTTDCLGYPIGCCKVSRDKLSILCACLDSCIRLVDKESGAVLTTYKGHKNGDYKMDCDFMCSDNYIVNGSEDGQIYIWDLITSNILKTIPAHSGPVYSLTYSPKVNRLLTSSHDGFCVWVGQAVPEQ